MSSIAHERNNDITHVFALRTKINIHAQPGLPRTPSIFWIAAAKSPENAPESEAAEKNNAMLYLVSKSVHRSEQQILYRSASSLRV